MAAEQSNPGREPTSPVDDGSSNNHPERRADDLHALDTNSRHYQEVMVRIRQLEAGMDGIGRQLKDLAGFSEQAYQDRSHDMSTLHARVDSLEKISLKPRIDSLESKVFGSRDSLPLAESTDDGTGHSRVAALSSRQRDDELAQMRFQIVNLKQQFGQAMEQLQKSNGSRPGRRVPSRHQGEVAVLACQKAALAYYG